MKEIISTFKEGYKSRDISKLDEFMDKLFDRKEKVLCVGTCQEELCLGYDEVREIFESDWQYWGDVSVKEDEAVVTGDENTKLIYLPSTVKYNFTTNEDKFESYLESVKEYFKEGTDESKKPDKEKLMEINWTLSHFLMNRDKPTRQYLWDLGISLVIVRKEGRWIVKYMQFSVPVRGFLPDVRYISKAYDNEDFHRIKEYSLENQCIPDAETRKFLDDFDKNYLKEDKNSFIEKYISKEDFFAVNTDGTIYKGINGAEAFLENNRNYFDTVEIDWSASYMEGNDGEQWVVAYGNFEKNLSEEKAIENARDKIKDILNSPMAAKDKLFNVRRSVADMLRGTSMGDKYVWPIRFEGLITRENGEIKFQYMQFSFPFQYYLEGKTEAAVRID